ncbi:DUF2569 family protein [Alkalibaculum sp. M08DMB]|uniref:DUF2569 family protein n=1 Tax=Alkalibaculum sporogenes TaxID=2655001 RepID=A0A6A7K586_9FIRM|nr:DUF2569 family protein [Alkalibaculum sporogenes]MPW24417.1 DUF2569 family protein [Alkalibaculum sporogenes]
MNNQNFEEEKVEGIGGWFLFYIISLIAGIFMVGNIVMTWDSVIQHGALVSSSIYIVLAIGILFLALFLLSIYKKSILTRAYAITVSAYVICFNIIGLIFFDNNNLLSIIVSTILAIIWINYFCKSKRVANTFINNYGDLSKIFLKILFISIFALLAVIHIILVVLVTGILPSLFTLILPVLSEMFWFINFWINHGFLNEFTSILILYCFGIVIPFLIMLFYSPNNK